MTVLNELKKCIKSAEDIRGSYSTMANTTNDDASKKMFTQMIMDIDKHIEYLNNRFNYIGQYGDPQKQKI